jgi:hypothetical protein
LLLQAGVPIENLGQLAILMLDGPGRYPSEQDVARNKNGLSPDSPFAESTFSRSLVVGYRTILRE